MPAENKIYLSTVDVPIRWSDMDAFGHVNNSVFFTYIEQARIEWWKQQKLPHFDAQKTFPVIVHTSCTYLKPIIYPEMIAIKIYVGSVGKSSYENFYEIYSKDDPTTLYAEASAKIVWIDKHTGRPTAIPNYITQLFPDK